ncbi:lectin-like domain-containing protein [Vagococcus fessus]|uniref:WxL domain-containing protein n=1 Tax=Vagococcus fessus TaxID=120370 RepID=A0A430A8F3_9ENTE|nr:hypothetical protein [Vagococcus fessus]RSU03395.1 hypothetical protein CBF31_06695 [Vagococcus fessus]
MKKFICLMSVAIVMGAPLSAVAVTTVNIEKQHDVEDQERSKEHKAYMVFTLDYLLKLKEITDEQKEYVQQAKFNLEQLSVNDNAHFESFSVKFSVLMEGLTKEHPYLIKSLNQLYDKQKHSDETKSTWHTETEESLALSSTELKESVLKETTSPNISESHSSEFSEAEEPVEIFPSEEISDTGETSKVEKEIEQSTETPTEEKVVITDNEDDFLLDGELTEAGLEDLATEGVIDRDNDEKEYSAEVFKKTPEKPTDEIIKSAPKGLALDDIFAVEDKQGDTYIEKVKDTDTDIVFITDKEKNNGKNQVGAIWATDKMKIDLENDFEAEMSLYLGGNGADAGDGMAFVLQNDDVQGTKAIGHGGAGLGVYGNPNATLEKFKKGSIQNSFVVEFDTHENGSTLDKRVSRHKIETKNILGGLLSTGYKTYYNRQSKQHIGATYPAFDRKNGLTTEDQNFYPDVPKMKYPAGSSKNSDPTKKNKKDGLLGERNWIANRFKSDRRPLFSYTSWFNKYPIINHDVMFSSKSLFDGTKQNLSNGKWHDFKVKYLTPQKHPDKKDAGMLELSFDGKVVKTVRRLDLDALNIEGSSKKKEVRWGFTGATGKKGSTQAVVFKQVPDLIEIEHEEDILDDSGQSIYSDGDKTKVPEVVPGGQLTYKNSVKYVSGKQQWLNPSIVSPLSDYFSYVKNSYELSYDNGKTWTKLSDKNLIVSTYQLIAKLPKTITAEGPDKVISRFKVDIEPTDTDIVVSGNTRYYGSNDSFWGDKLAYKILASTMKADMIITGDLTDSDKVESNRKVKGEIKNIEEPYQNLPLEVKLSGDPAVDGKVVEVTEGEDGSKLFEFVSKDKTFTASNRIRAKLVPKKADKEEIVSVASKEVMDKTAPTGEAEDLITTFVRTSKEVEAIELDPYMFVNDLDDTNPIVKLDDIVVSFVDEKQLKKDLQKVSEGVPYKVKLRLEDPAGNINESIETDLKVVDEDDRVDLIADDEVTVKSADIGDTEKIQLNPDESVITQVLTEEGHWDAIFREEDLTETSIAEFIKPDYDKLDYLPGSYDVMLTLEYTESQEGEEEEEDSLGHGNRWGMHLKFLKPKEAELARAQGETVYKKNKMVKVHVIDGELSLGVEGELSYKGLLQSKAEQLKPLNEFNLSVKDDRYIQKGWELTVKNSKFLENETKLKDELPLNLLLVDKEGNALSNLTTSEQTIKTGDEKELELPLGKGEENEQRLETAVGASSHSWATANDTFTSELTWNIRPEDKVLTTVVEKLSVKKGANLS